MQNASTHIGVSPRWTLAAIGLGAFGIGTTEFAPMGLLPAISRGLDVSIPAAGQLVTAYAVGVMISAPLVTLGLARYGQRRALLISMAIYIIGNLVSALAPEYWTLMVGRIITSLCQGAFFGFGAVAATSVVPPEKRASAVAIMFMGTSVANIGGVPAAAWLGDLLGWRMAFGVTVLIGLAAILALAKALPDGEPGRTADIRRELGHIANGQMVITLASTVLFASCFFATYTYVAPILEKLAGASGSTITLVLVLIGVGLTAGNWIGGKLADWSLKRGAVVAMLSLTVSSVALPLLTASTTSVVLALVVWAVASFSCVPSLQLRAMQAADGAPTLAASLNIAAFNFGNAIGAAVGGLAIGFGAGYGSVPIAGALMSAIGLAILLVRPSARSGI